MSDALDGPQNSPDATHTMAPDPDLIAQGIDEHDRIRYARPGISWKALVVFLMPVAIAALFGHHLPPLLLLLVIFTALMALHNAIYICAARLVGVRRILSIGVWVGPPIAWCTIRDVIVRLNFLPLGAYVRFPSPSLARGATTIDQLGPLQKAAVLLSAPVGFTIAGWAICAVYGIADGPARALNSLLAWGPHSWENCRRLLLTFLAGLNSFNGICRAIGILLLANGIINLMPLPVLSGGAAIFSLFEPLLSKKNSIRVQSLLQLLSLPVLLFTAGVLLFMLVQIVFGHS